jgi:hypothetical protein
MRINIVFRCLFYVMVSASAAWAGDYGLTITMSLPKECSKPLRYGGQNECTPEAVIADFKRYFTKAGDFQIEAVHTAFIHNEIHPSSKAETTAFCKGLAGLVADPKIKREKELIDFVNGVSYWAKKAMPLALYDEMNRSGLSLEARKKLEHAIQIVEGNK